MASIAQKQEKYSPQKDATGAMTLAALDSLNRGWSIIPVRGKRPAVDALPGGKWAQLQKKPLSIEAAYVTFRKDSTLGLGIVTGEVSGIVVLDIDPRNFDKGENPLAGRHLPHHANREDAKRRRTSLLSTSRRREAPQARDSSRRRFDPRGRLRRYCAQRVMSGSTA